MFDLILDVLRQRRSPRKKPRFLTLQGIRVINRFSSSFHETFCRMQSALEFPKLINGRRIRNLHLRTPASMDRVLRNRAVPLSAVCAMPASMAT
jgi:hypothetical protein